MMPKLNDIDRNLLRLVQADSSLAYAALGREVGLSVSAVNERVRKLERTGAIRGYGAMVDPLAANAHVLAFAEISVPEAKIAAALVAALAERPEAQEIHRTAGTHNLLVKLRAPSPAALQALLDDTVGAHEGVTANRVSVALTTEKESPALPVFDPA